MDVGRILGAIGGGVGGMLLGGPIGAAAGSSLGYFAPEIGSGAKQVLGNPVGGTIAGGAIGGIAGFALGGPIGALAGGMLGGTVGGSIGTMIQMSDMQQHQQKAMMQMYSGANYYGSYGAGMGMGYPEAMGDSAAAYGYGINSMYGQGSGQAYGSYSQNAYNASVCYGYLGVNQYQMQQQPKQRAREYSGITSKLENGSVEYLSSGGYRINVNGKNLYTTDTNGQSAKIWGDTHVTEAGGSGSIVFLLGDGTKVTLQVDAPNGHVKETNIYDGNSQVKIDNDRMSFTTHYSQYNEDAGELDAEHGDKGEMKELYNQGGAYKQTVVADPAKSDTGKSGPNFSSYTTITAIMSALGVAALLKVVL
ncbi:MAG: hypothetical protein M1269_08825 [Chloroflexi bacterium]|nr:hypothetical protein [Chloroflexota bacterium]